MSSYFSNLMYGPNPLFLRETFPKDTLEAIKTTHDYQGKVYLVKNDGSEKSIDHAVVVRTVSDLERRTAQAYHASNAFWSHAVGTVSLVGSFATWIAGGMDKIPGNISLPGGAVLFVSSILNFYRGSEANGYKAEWKDSLPKLCVQRRHAKDNFHYVFKNDLKGKLVTQDEAAQLFDDSMKIHIFEIEKAMRHGSNAAMKRFLAEGPLWEECVNYVYPGDSLRLANIKNPADGYWLRASMNKVCHDFSDIVEDARQWKFKKEQSEAEIARKAQVQKDYMNKIEAGTNLVAGGVKVGCGTGFNKQRDDALAPFMAVRDHELNEASRNAATYIQEALRINQEYNNNPEVKAIMRRHASNTSNCDSLDFIRDGVSAFLAIQKSDIDRNKKEELKLASEFSEEGFRREFQKPINSVLDGYKRAYNKIG